MLLTKIKTSLAVVLLVGVVGVGAGGWGYHALAAGEPGGAAEPAKGQANATGGAPRTAAGPEDDLRERLRQLEAQAAALKGEIERRKSVPPWTAPPETRTFLNQHLAVVVKEDEGLNNTQFKAERDALRREEAALAARLKELQSLGGAAAAEKIKAAAAKKAQLAAENDALRQEILEARGRIAQVRAAVAELTEVLQPPAAPDPRAKPALEHSKVKGDPAAARAALEKAFKAYLDSRGQNDDTRGKAFEEFHKALQAYEQLNR